MATLQLRQFRDGLECFDKLVLELLQALSRCDVVLGTSEFLKSITLPTELSTERLDDINLDGPERFCEVLGLVGRGFRCRRLLLKVRCLLLDGLCVLVECFGVLCDDVVLLIEFRCLLLDGLCVLVERLGVLRDDVVLLIKSRCLLLDDVGMFSERLGVTA